MDTRRMLTVGGGAAALLALAGCTSLGPTPVRKDGSYCYPSGRRTRSRQTCTPGAVPSAAAEAEARQLLADPGALTVYVLRLSLGDTHRVIEVMADDRAVAATVPASLVRLKLGPGFHTLSAAWNDQVSNAIVDGSTGGLRAMELIGTTGIWGHRILWQARSVETLRERLTMARLVADVDLRR